jgi:hypothetical protein
MDDVKQPTPRIRSASDDAAASTVTRKPIIRSASEEHAPKVGATLALASRGSDQPPRPWSPKLSAPIGAGTLPDASRAAELGNALTTGYGTAFSEALTFMSQAVERQNEMMSSMLHARGPQDVVIAGSRYLLGGWLAFFEVNVRIAHAASRLSEGAKHGMTRNSA